MRADEIVVVAVAVAAILWVNWFFFFAERVSPSDDESHDRDNANPS